MRIVLIVPNLNVGGGQRYVTEIANLWNQKGYTVTIISLRNEKCFYPIDEGIIIEKLGYETIDSNVKKVFTGFQLIINLRNRINSLDPDIIISILSTTNILTLLATMFLGKRVFIRDVFSQTRKRKFLERFGRRILYRYATGIIAQTEEIKDWTEQETGNKNIRVIRNPVRKFEEHEKIKRDRIILNVGALIKRKGQMHILEVSSQLNSPDWKFVILGEGKERIELESQIIKRNLNDNVELKGAVQNVDEWLQKSSIFIFPSFMEGLPNALIEAMAAGLPCVSYDCETGPRDLIIDGKNGFLVDTGDIKGMLERIKELISNVELRKRMSAEAKKSVSKYRVEVISEEVLDFCSNNK